MKENDRHMLMGGMLIGVLIALIVFFSGVRVANLLGERETCLLPQDLIVAYNSGAQDALKTNPASWDLEMACLEMWANKQPNQSPLK